MYPFLGLMDDLTLIQNNDAKAKTHKKVSYLLQFRVQNRQFNKCLSEIENRKKAYY